MFVFCRVAVEVGLGPSYTRVFHWWIVWVLKRVLVKRVGGENRGAFCNSSYLLRR